jgi:hypothetical protein
MIKQVAFQFPARTFSIDPKTMDVFQEAEAWNKYFNGPIIMKSFYYKPKENGMITFQKDVNFTKIK